MVSGNIILSVTVIGNYDLIDRGWLLHFFSIVIHAHNKYYAAVPIGILFIVFCWYYIFFIHLFILFVSATVLINVLLLSR